MELAYAGSLEGKLYERGTRSALGDVSVLALPSRKRSVTTADGAFRFDGLEEETITLVVNLTGYQRLERSIEMRPRESVEGIALYLERDSYLTYETTVYGKEQRRDSSVKVMKREEILKAPGSLGDPVRATQNLPGVNRPQALSSQVVIQGAGPRDTQYLVNGHVVPQVFHFGGLSSIMLPEATDRVELFQAGYGSEWGRALGGIVGLWSRAPRRDRVHGLGFADLLNAGALVEGPVGSRGGFLVGARRSYIGNVLRAAFKNSPDFNLTVAPAYSDSILQYNAALTDLDEFSLTALGSQDELQFLLSEPLKQDPVLRGSFESSTRFFRVIPQWLHRHGENTSSRWSFSLGRDWVKVLNNDNYFYLTSTRFSVRGELDRKMSELWTTQLGIDNSYYWARVNISLPNFFNQGGVSNPLSSGTIQRTNTFGRAALTGIYSRNEVRWEGTSLTLLPSARLERFSSTNETLLSPRPGFRYTIDKSLELRGSGGLYYQPPEPEEVDPTFGNPSLMSPRAWHANLGLDKDFRNGTNLGWNISSDIFYKKLERLVVPSSVVRSTGQGFAPENYNNNGSGAVIGGQLQARYSFEPFSLQTIYTLSRSRRSEPGRAEYPARYDQTHLLGLVGSVTLPANWTLSARFRYATGNPTTPVVGAAYDADSDVYVPIRGAFYSERVPDFFQADLRIDKKWIFDQWILSLYLDVQNVTNRRNVEGQIYSYDYRKTAYLTGLPILPLLGVKGEF